MLGFDTLSDAPLSGLTGAQPVAIALTQVNGTGSVGTVVPNSDTALTAVNGTGSVGSFFATINTALTQVVGTGSVGLVSPALSISLTQVIGTGSLGSVALTRSVGVTQVTGTGTLGTVIPNTSVLLSNVTGTGSVGSVNITHTNPLTNVFGTGSVGTVVYTSIINVALTGVSGIGSVGSLGSSIIINVAITGVSGTGSVGNLGSSIFRDIWTENGLVVNTGLISEPSIEWITDPTVPYSGVISISPPAGSVVNQWTPVTLYASIGPPNSVQMVTVPDVVGQQSYQARTACFTAGLLVDNYVWYDTNGVVDPGYVVSQSLTPGAIVVFGTLITLTVSNG